jgi:uncharacterized protein YbjT (DUF2867 family)
MKFTIIGGAGHISKIIVGNLLQGGQQVTTVARNAAHVEPLVAQGAKAAIGSVEDVKFLTKAFAGADVVYTMVPPNFGAANWLEWISQQGKNYAEAIKASDVKYVVNLSSVGAHLPAGAGPISGLHAVEETLNQLQGVNVRHLRPGYFFENLLSNVDLAKKMNIIGGNFGGGDFKMVMTTPADIAEVATEELLLHNFTGHSVKYIASDERTTDDIARVLGEAISKPDLRWVTFGDEDARNAMVTAGLPLEVAKNYTEMGQGFRTGIVLEEYWKDRPESLQKTKLEDFAKTFSQVYNQDAVPVH